MPPLFFPDVVSKPECTQIAHRHPSGSSPQTQESQGIPHWEPFLCVFGQIRKDPAFQGSARWSFSKFRDLGSAIWRVREDTFPEQVRVRQENMTATWGSARSTLSKVLAFREIILLNLVFTGVLLRWPAQPQHSGQSNRAKLQGSWRPAVRAIMISHAIACATEKGKKKIIWLAMLEARELSASTPHEVVLEWVCAPCVCVAQTCAVRPILARVVGELWTANPSRCPRGYAEDAKIWWGKVWGA